MHEGWHHNDYLILFSEPEAADASLRYGVAQWLPGFSAVGLRSWDNLIVKNSATETFSVPVVPMQAQYLSPFALPPADTVLRGDERFTGKIKWYAKPIVFGGAPDRSENLVWVSYDEHVKLVSSWNEKYLAAKANASHG